MNGILVYLTVEMSVILNGILVYYSLEMWGYIEWYTCIFYSRDVRLYWMIYLYIWLCEVILNDVLVYLTVELWGYIEWYTCIFNCRVVRLYWNLTVFLWHSVSSTCSLRVTYPCQLKSIDTWYMVHVFVNCF